MNRIYNINATKSLRRKLCQDQTEIESLLWGQLRGKRFFGLKFFRQYGVDSYILDFYCPKQKFAIEVDGSRHAEKDCEEYDSERTRFLESLGIRVFRVWNNDVSQDMNGVLDGVYHAIFESQTPSNSPFVKGGEESHFAVFVESQL